MRCRVKILIFGGLGKTAETIIELLDKRKHSITAFDISNNNQYSHNKDIKVIHGDICNREAVKNALSGIDIVLHLAVNISAPHDNELSFRTNVFGTYNILNCALLNKVSKILIASSAPVHNTNNLVKLTGTDTDVDYICSSGEDFPYDLTKYLQETTAKHFTRTFSMNCLVLRLGHIVDGKRQTTLSGVPLSELTYCKGGWVCRYDVARAFAEAVETDFTGYHVINIIGSYQAADMFDLSTTKELLSFECEEKFLDY